MLGDKARFKVTGGRDADVQGATGSWCQGRSTGRSFKAGSGKHTVKIVLNGDAVKTFKVKA